MKIAIAIPARYGSTRFPGKPLAMIGGKTMLSRVVELARSVAETSDNIDVFVTTDDERIAAHTNEIGVECVMTPPECATGSDRVLAAINLRTESDKKSRPDYVINLQGDAPFTPREALEALISTIAADSPKVVTPVHRLSWDDLDRLRESKKQTPFSGTCAVVNEKGDALWFSKNIIPAIRKEDTMRESGGPSPVRQHMGVYAYRTEVLEEFCKLPQGTYEKLEGLEQLRLIENGIPIRTVEIDIPPGQMQSGIDTPEDLARAEKILLTTDKHG